MRALASKRIVFIWILAAVVLGGALGGCSSSSPQTGLEMYPAANLPQGVQDSAQTVVEAYQFAVANPEIMQEIPCYCGCAPMGHTSNYACYVSEVNADGEIVYDDHALGCSICVDITQDVMVMLQEGKTVEEIRPIIDQTYSRYGPSNME
jgi:hypothetical protein